MTDGLPDSFAAFRLDGRIALVTGARREIGRAIALALGGAGARIAVHHAGGPEEASDAAEVVARLHASTLPRPAGSAAFETQVAVNLRATLDLLQALVPAMAERGWGLAVCRQYGRQGVTVNNLAPGAIATARNRTQLADPTVRDWLLGRIPTGRFGTPDDLAGAALLLCSDAGAYINGAHLHADGGRMLG